jgi:pilus assembly protein CpaE
MMVDLPRVFRSIASRGSTEPVRQVCVAVALEAIGGEAQLTSLAALFPHVVFEPLYRSWPERLSPDLDVLVTSVDAGRPAEIDQMLARVGLAPAGTRIAIVLRNADVTTTRRLIRAGAADVLPAPVSEPALAVSLERLLSQDSPEVGPTRKTGELVAVLKAGGGVGASALCVQAAFLLAQRGAAEVCVADLDLQFGSTAVYMDLPDAVTLTDCLSSGSGLAETPYASALAKHRSGARLLAASNEIVPLETLNPDHADALVRGLRRDFALTLVDLPTVWTAWTNQILMEADRIVLVTHLAVTQIQLVKRQLRMLKSQLLDEKPITLVANAVTADQTKAVSVKAAERAIGRNFDVVIPEDRRLMDAALNEGVELASVRRGTKLEKAVGELADKLLVSIDARSRR